MRGLKLLQVSSCFLPGTNFSEVTGYGRGTGIGTGLSMYTDKKKKNKQINQSVLIYTH